MKKHPLSDLDADIRDHIERETQDNVERGMSPEEARYAALRKFGNVALVREDTRAVWVPVWLDQVRQDVRYALRTIRRAPGFAAIAVGSSALGIGACAVIFAMDLSISPDYRVLLFCIAQSVLTAVAFGLVPALRATRADLVTDLKADTRGTATVARFGLRNGLVVAQVAICTVLLVCTGLFLRSLQTARGIDLGLTNRNLLLMAFDPALDRRPAPRAKQLLRDILERAQAIPGVESATLTSAVPLTFIVLRGE